MATMKHVNEVTNALLGGGRADSFSNEKARHVIGRITALGRAIEEEQGCDSSQVAALPDDTVLGPKAEAAFLAFRALLSE